MTSAANIPEQSAGPRSGGAAPRRTAESAGAAEPRTEPPPVISAPLVRRPPAADPALRACELRELREEFFEERARLRWTDRPEPLEGAPPFPEAESEPSQAGTTEPHPPPSAQHAQRLQAIERALELFCAGEYGRCRCCGDPISMARLRARPDTQHCCACARRQTVSDPDPRRTHRV